MIANIIKFTIEAQVDVISYDLPLETSQSETGKVVISGNLTFDPSYSIIAIENVEGVYAITSASTSDDSTTTLTVGDTSSVFDNVIEENIFKLVSPTSTSYTTLHDAFVGTFSNVYGTDYKSHSWCLWGYFYSKIVNLVKNSDTYGWEVKALAKKIIDDAGYTDSDGVFNVGDNSNSAQISLGKVIRWYRQRGVIIGMEISKLKYGCYIQMTVDAVDFGESIPIFFNDKTILESESYDDDICSCVHVQYSKADSTQGWDSNVFKLRKDGTIWSINQAKGTPEYIQPGYSDYVYVSGTYSLNAAQAKAEEIFAENTSSHKVTFYSTYQFHIGQPVTLHLSRGNLDTAISSVNISSDHDGYYLYTCGELDDTVTSMIKANSWTYGSRTPTLPRKGQLVIAP